jgi:hypothetical protein
VGITSTECGPIRVRAVRIDVDLFRIGAAVTCSETTGEEGMLIRLRSPLRIVGAWTVGMTDRTTTGLTART